MQTTMRVSGRSLAMFMMAFQRTLVKAPRSHTPSPMQVAIENNAHLLVLDENGIPINLVNENGRLPEDWFLRMQETDQATIPAWLVRKRAPSQAGQWSVYFENPPETDLRFKPGAEKIIRSTLSEGEERDGMMQCLRSTQGFGANHHWHLSGTGLHGFHDGLHKHGTNIGWDFARAVEISFEKAGFPDEQTLLDNLVARRRQDLIELVNAKWSDYQEAELAGEDMGLYRKTRDLESGREKRNEYLAKANQAKSDLGELINLFDFNNLSGDTQLFPVPLKEKIVQVYAGIMREISEMKALFASPDFSKADPLLNSAIWHWGNQGTFNTRIIAAGGKVDAQMPYEDFIINDMAWLTDRYSNYYASRLMFQQSVFPTAVGDFLKSLGELVAKPEGRAAFYVQLHFLTKTLKTMKKGIMPNDFSMPLYFHNSGNYRWSVDLWI